MSKVAGATNKDNWFVGDHYCFECSACKKITQKDNDKANKNIEKAADERWAMSRQNLRSFIIPASYKQGSKKAGEPQPSYRTKALPSSFDDAPTRRLENQRNNVDFVWSQLYQTYVDETESLSSDDGIDEEERTNSSQHSVQEYGVKCSLCDRFVASRASLIPHQIQCARKQTVQQTPCPTCKWPVLSLQFFVYIYMRAFMNIKTCVMLFVLDLPVFICIWSDSDD